MPQFSKFVTSPTMRTIFENATFHFDDVAEESRGVIIGPIPRHILPKDGKSCLDQLKDTIEKAFGTETVTIETFDNDIRFKAELTGEAYIHFKPAYKKHLADKTIDTPRI